jgi:uncharacterized BrkB/YihY/UPF0761 family membrane protein
MLAFIVMFLIGLFTLLSAWIPPVETLYTTFVGAVISLFSIYCGANIGNKYVVSRFPSEMAKLNKPNTIVGSDDDEDKEA